MDSLHTRLAQICATHGINILYLFGSRGLEFYHYLHGASSPPSPGESDLDVGVLPASPLSVQQKVELALQLEVLFSVPRIDLVVLTEADPFLATNIIRGERAYAKSEYEADEYDLYVLRRAGDLAFHEHMRMDMILKGF
jgi:predicted nucleotidyltransferase